ncbi:MAG: hypothetical protein KDD03_13105 [Gelidibacter sp.]|nr:hypothetical protein [Gelidibacter sp.]
MNLPLPDKEVRKAIYTLVNNITVDSKTIKCYDTRVTGSTIPDYYVLMTTQTNSVDESVKCGDRWESSILLDIVTRYPASGNTGSRLFADNIADAIRALLVNKLTLGQGLKVVHQKLDFPNDLTSVTDNENIFRKFIRVELTIN